MWDKANTMEPTDLLEHYATHGALTWARYHYETWRKTTAMIDPPAAWDNLDVRIKVALCAVANAVKQSCDEIP